MDTLLNLKNNLIQNFYVLGLCPDRFFQVQEDGHGVFLNIFKDPKMELTPEIISKFPPENGNYNSAKDEMVLAHCFPKGLHVLQTNEEKKPCTHFEFHLDNLLFNYNEEERRIYSKIYFTCLEFYESLEIYNNYKKEIIYNINTNKNTTIEILKDGINDVVQSSSSTYLKRFYVPKIICFASLLPFSNELFSILNIIHQIYVIRVKDSSVLPIEKFIEQIVLQIPIPLTINTQINLSFKFHGIDLMSKEVAKAKSKQKSKSSEALFTPSFSAMRKEKEEIGFSNKIHFPLFNVNEAYIKFDHTISMEECFSFFQVDDIIKIFKYILLEVPILFFCSEKSILSTFIENFLGLLSPFKYILPNISILPNKFYGLINSEPKFLFGINEKYSSDFFKANNIDIDKNIIVVNIDVENRTESKIEEIIKKKDDEEKNYLLVNYNYNSINAQNKANVKNKNSEKTIITNDYVIYDSYKTELINIEMPEKKKLSNKLSSCIMKKKSKKGDSEENFNYKIQCAFYKFLVDTLAGYSDYFLKSEYFYEATKNKNCGDNMRYKSQTPNNSDISFLRELFNIDEFVFKASRELQPFYYVFFNTKIFLYYLRDRIYSEHKVNSLPYLQFDQLVYLKKHSEARKKYKGLYEDLKKGNFEKPKPEKVLDINIKTSYNFTPIELKNILDVNNKTDILIKYAQLVNGIDQGGTQVKINYLLFPKLLFDDSFFETNYENTFFMHEIELPSNRYFQEFKKACIVKADMYEKQRKPMLYPHIIEGHPLTSRADFTIDVYEYIMFDWFILLCCSLWYCEQIEREIRLNKIFELFDKISYIEEKVLIFIYLNFLKYGNKTQCIKMLEKMSKFIGHSNYLYLSSLCIKLESEDDKKINNEIIDKYYNNKNNDKKYTLKRRSIILSNENFFQKRCSMPVRDNFRNMEDENRLKYTMVSQNKKNKKNNQNEINHKEKIIFNQGQLCPKCKEISYFDSNDIIGLSIHSVKVNFEFKCKKCGEKKNSIDIKYQILLINKNKNQSFITKIGEFKLLSPYRLYTNLKLDQLTRRDYSLKIDNIYNEKKNELFNYIYYFCRKNLTFDFLIPYKTLNEIDMEIIENRLGSIISDINRQRFSIIGQINTDNLLKEMENEFVPINISENSNLDKNIFDDLTPIYATGVIDGIYGSSIEGENNNNPNSFSILTK
jgi:hypothetical protein